MPQRWSTVFVGLTHLDAHTQVRTRSAGLRAGGPALDDEELSLARVLTRPP